MFWKYWQEKDILYIELQPKVPWTPFRLFKSIQNYIYIYINNPAIYKLKPVMAANCYWGAEMCFKLNPMKRKKNKCEGNRTVLQPTINWDFYDFFHGIAQSVNLLKEWTQGKDKHKKPPLHLSFPWDTIFEACLLKIASFGSHSTRYWRFSWGGIQPLCLGNNPLWIPQPLSLCRKYVEPLVEIFDLHSLFLWECLKCAEHSVSRDKQIYILLIGRFHH